MKKYRRSPFAIKAELLACLLAVTALLAGSWQAQAQAATSSSSNQGSPSGSLETLAGHTPPQVLNGAATRLGVYDPSKKLRLVIGLQHPNLAGEEELLKELQTKGSPNFQKFLTPAEWNSRFSPSAADEQAVIDWAGNQGFAITQRYPNRLLVDVEGTVATIQKALGVTINTYQVGDRVAYSNDKDPVIPASLSNVIHSLGGLNSIQVLRPNNKSLKEPAFADYSDGPVFAAGPKDGKSATAKRPSSATGPKANITGGAYDPTDIYSSQAYDLNALYAQGHCCNPLGNSGVTPPSSSIAIATAGTQSGSDFAGFQSTYPYLAYHYQQYYIDGTPSCCDGEGTEDFDWSTAWSNSFGSYVNTSMIYLYDGVNNSFATFTDVYNAIYTGGNAKIFTTSWGCEETACTPNSVMDTDHGIFNSMIGTGMTLMAASGDQGATAGCGDAVAVQYPASDPNIVGAGGTTLSLNSSSVFVNEVAWSGGPYGCGSNDGGSTGGESSYYAKPSYQSSISGLGSNRYVPDIALNADWYYTPQNIYYGGALEGNGGTSIVAPSLAGFFAQTNAYLDYVATINGGCYGGTTCSAIGNGNYYLYWFGENQSYAPHYPFYDITSGCNNNDITAEYGLGYYCTATGYDPVTGWGSINALQLARAITTYRAYYGTTTATFSGPTINHWYNTDEETTWTVTAAGQAGYASTGVAGYTVDWDAAITDSTTASRPATGDSFFAGVEFPNATTGGAYVSGAGQGCHTLYVRSWDNSGGGGYQSYGPVCYDTVAPVTTAILSGTENGSVYISPVKVTLNATDASSGVKTTYYQLDGGATTTYSSAFTVSATGSHTLKFWSVDNAGNTETENSLSFTIATAPTATLSATSLAYGSEAVGSSTASQGVTLVNNGGSALSITSIVLGGTNPTSFVFSNNCGSSLAAGANCGIHGHFAPTTTGALSAKITITDNASGSPQTITLSGTGTPAPAAVTLSATSLAYGSEPVGVSTASQVVTLTNSGGSTLDITSIVLGGTNASSFVFVNNCPSTLAAGAKCGIQGHFDPTTTGALTAKITITDNASGSPQTIALSGTGTGAPAAVTLSATSLAYGSETVGVSTASQVVTLTNSGGSTLDITSIVLGGANASSFAFVNNCPSTLAAGAKCGIQGHFDPTTTGALTATVTITDSASGSPQSIALSGTGTPAPAKVTLSATSLAFGTETVGTSTASQGVTLTNSGGTTLNITSIVLGGADPSSFVFANNCGATLAAGANCGIHGHFDPTTTGALTATITITDSASGSPQTISLSGTGN